MMWWTITGVALVIVIGATLWLALGDTGRATMQIASTLRAGGLALWSYAASKLVFRRGHARIVAAHGRGLPAVRDRRPAHVAAHTWFEVDWDRLRDSAHAAGASTPSDVLCCMVMLAVGYPAQQVRTVFHAVRRQRLAGVAPQDRSSLGWAYTYVWATDHAAGSQVGIDEVMSLPPGACLVVTAEPAAAVGEQVPGLVAAHVAGSDWLIARMHVLSRWWVWHEWQHSCVAAEYSVVLERPAPEAIRSTTG